MLLKLVGCSTSGHLWLGVRARNGASRGRGGVVILQNDQQRAAEI